MRMKNPWITFNSFHFPSFCTFTYFLNSNVLLKLMVTELNMDLEASLSVYHITRSNKLKGRNTLPHMTRYWLCEVIIVPFVLT